jgi:hypothetical protein
VGADEAKSDLSFDYIWQKYFHSLEGAVLETADRRTIRIAHVGPNGVSLSLHRGASQFIHIFVFKQFIKQLLKGEKVSWELMRNQFSARTADSLFFLASRIPIFEITEGFRNKYISLRPESEG